MNSALAMVFLRWCSLQGTESGDEDERSPSSKPSSGRDHAPAQDQTTTLGTKSPRDSSAAGRRKSGDESEF